MMIDREEYRLGLARGAVMRKAGKNGTYMFVRGLRHSQERGKGEAK